MSQIIISNGTDKSVLPKPQKTARVYACSRCPKTFKRSEHCSRHERGHTQEKPFHCRYCGRRYARKDLVSRHEKSFHPHADKLNSDVDVIMVNDRRPPTPPEPPQSKSSPKRSPIATSGASRESEGNLSLPDRASQDSPSNFLDTLLSPPRSDLTSLESEAQSLYFKDGQMLLESESMSPLHQATKVTRANSNSANGCPPLLMDQSGTETASIGSVQQSMPDLSTWHPPDMMWTDGDQFTDGEFAPRTSNVPAVPNLGSEDQTDTYFRNIDLLSMMPKNGMDFEADFSTYLFHSGYSPPEQVEIPSKHQQNFTRPQTSTSNLCPLIEARAVAFDTDSESGTFARMPSLMAETPRKLPIPVVNLEAYETILSDVKARLSQQQLEQLEMLSAQDMQRYLTSYFTCFHRHCPVIHIPSLDLKTTPSHLIFAICAIGALYRLSRKTAKDLWYWADHMVEKETPVTSSNLLSRSSTASVQCKMLLGMFAMFSGDLTEHAISRAGYWCTEYRVRRSALALLPHAATSGTWESWISRETSKRLLYGIYIMSSLMTVAYDLSPSFSVTQDLEIEILDEECLWEATTSQQWETLKKSQTPRTPTTVRDAMTHLIYGKEQSTAAAHPIKWTAFATTMVFHAVNINMWNVMQCTQSFTAFAVDEQINKDLKAALVAQVETALARCYAFLTVDRSERDHTSDDPEGPLIFNCLALLRSAYVRVFAGLGSFNRMMLLSEEPLQVVNSIKAYVACGQERSSFMTRAVDKAYGGLLTPIKAGYILVQKTAALTWSVEHAVAAWDCALFVTKWIHAMEMQQLEVPPDEDELRNLINFRELLAEVDSGYNGSGSLAGEVARVWASFLDDTWVWGITPRMGQVLRQLSSAFSEDWEAKFPQGNDGGPISR